VQLADLLGDALAAQRFKLGHKLSTGRTADAMIMMPGPMAPLAIDARFPAEVFDAWQMSRNAGTEMELRRAVLRNIADAGEKLISPEETADCALMFVPSENILSELHASFSDLIQESYRARVWMVSPTSLMATLHTISAVMAGAGIKEASTANVIDELYALRSRVSALETQRANGARHPAEPAAVKRSDPSEKPAQDRSPSTPERIGETAAQKAPDDKSPFPLR
jgi:DNA recombination protein RmuC